MKYQLKLPLVVDVSKQDLGAPLAQANPKPEIIIARACVAYFPSDDTPYTCSIVEADTSAEFVWNDAKLNNVKSTVYAYILQDKMDEQIKKFIDYCKQAGFFKDGKWQMDYPPVCDVEVEADPQDYPDALRGTKWADQIKQWLDAVEVAFGVRPIIYTAQEQWKWLCANGVAPSWTKDYQFWLKFYPFDDWVDKVKSFPPSALPNGVNISQVLWWQYRDDGREKGYQYSDMNTIVKQKGIVLSFPKSEVDLRVTPEMDVYPLQSALEQAQANGWDGAINCGAGFTYTDPAHAKLVTEGSPSLDIDGQAVYYVRQVIKGGVVVTDKTAQTAPWTMLGWDDTRWYFAVSYGLEGTWDALTEKQAAEWFLSFGVKEAVLFDSGHSSQIASDGKILYWPYETQGERVPQCLGWKFKTPQTGGSMKKGTQISGYTNVKPMDGVGVTYQLQVDESVYGDPSTAGTDIVNIQNIHKADGTIVPLGKNYKAAITINLRVEDVSSEPTGTTPPAPPSTPITVTISGKKADGTAWSHTIDSEGNIL